MRYLVAFRILVFLLALPVLSFSAGAVHAVDILEAGNWSFTVDGNDLLAGPGSDLASSYESNADQGLLTISGTMDAADAWRVDVRRIDTVWDPNLALSVRRTSDGDGAGSISGGSGYQVLSDIDGTFFSGNGDRSSISVQVRITGVSIDVPPGAYSTSIVYTVVDI